MKTVVLFLPTLNDGGAENVVKEYALRLDKNRFNVIVIVVQSYLHNPSAIYEVLSESPIEVIDLYPHNIPVLYQLNLITRIWHHFFDTFYVALRIKKIIEERHVEILHAHMRVLHYLMPIRKSLKGIKLLYTCHSLPERWLGETCKDEFNAAKYLICNNQLQMIGLHEEMAQALNDMFDISNTLVLSNGADYKTFNSIIESKEEIRQRLGIPLDAFVLGHVGHFVPSKNHAYIVRVFHKLYLKNRNAFLLLIGHGSGEIQRDLLEYAEQRGFKDRVRILSHRKDIPELMKSMDAFIFPSKFEGFGIAVVEAQMAGLRCAVSDNVPQATILSPRTIPLSLEDPVDMWCDALTNEEVRNKKYGRMSDCNWDHIVDQLTEIYLS